MIEEQQRNMGSADFWSLDPVLLSVDAGPVQVCRQLKTLIAVQ